MRSVLLSMMVVYALGLAGQVTIGKPWRVEIGASTNRGFRESSNLNVRYISPRFKWSEYELTEEEEKHPEWFQNTRLMIEMIYKPAFKALCLGFNVQSRLLYYKKFSGEIYGGLKFFPRPGQDFITIPYLKGGQQFWYMNLGILFQIDLGMMAPFADVGGDGILTIGTELKFHAIYRKPKSRYNLKTRPAGK